MGPIVWLKQILRAVFKRLQLVHANLLSSSLRFLRVFRRQLWSLLRFFSRQNRPGIACSSVPVNAPVPPVLPRNSYSSLAPPSMSNSTTPNYVPDIALRRRLVPCTAKDVRRFDEKEKVPDKESNIVTIPPVWRRYLPPDDPVRGFEPCVHPGGALFFLDKHRRIFTDTNLQIQIYRDRILQYADELYWWYLQAVGPSFANSMDIVLQLNSKEQDESCGYYLVDHVNKTIFWLQPMALARVTQDIKGATEEEHIGYAIQTQYWRHCELYPIGQGTQDKHFSEGLMLELIYARTATLTSGSSTHSPFNTEELATLSDIVDKIILAKENQETYPPHHMWALARIMGFFTQTKFYNFCGQPCARVYADQRIYFKEKSSFTALSVALDIVSFGAVRIHMAQIRRIWVERSVSFLRWKDFNAELSGEWNNITIYSTVMLAVDISLLAVPSIPPSPSVTVLATQMSVIFIMGSIVSSVFLSLQNRRYGREYADIAASFLAKMTDSVFGTKALAFVYSLPLVLLAWGMLCFVLAFLYFVFISHFKVALATVGCVSFIVIMLISWPIWHRVYWLFARLCTRNVLMHA
ncbi:hypothetical protein P692DRAFT_20838861 [Suillus brevipes Sb2]|nr:hypothetical protein P692DRAFT_20838861 [Suillus brevipes Sb2]